MRAAGGKEEGRRNSSSCKDEILLPPNASLSLYLAADKVKVVDDSLLSCEVIVAKFLSEEPLLRIIKSHSSGHLVIKSKSVILRSKKENPLSLSLARLIPTPINLLRRER
jgi:hypothetical protein